jgi:hypothetical protein
VSQETLPALPPSKLRVLAIVLTASPVILSIITAVLLGNGTLGAPEPGVVGIRMILTMIAFVLLGGAFVVRSQIFKRIPTAPPDAKLRLYTLATIGFFAFLEGAMIVGVLVWLLTRDPLPGVVPAVLAFALALCSLPSDDQFEDLCSGH